MTASIANPPVALSPAPWRHMRWWLWPLVLLLLGAWSLLFGEMFLRLFSPMALVPRYVTDGGDGIRANIPNMRFRQWTPEVDVQLHYNEEGMRDDRPPPPVAKRPGECRVAIIGDSFFVGFESSWSNSFAMQLEKSLQSAGLRCRVLNFAVSGFGDGEMLIALDSRVRKWKPDLVVVSIHRTDGLDNLRSGLFRIDGQGALQRTGSSYLPGITVSDRLNRYALYRWLQENSQIYSAGREWIGQNGKKLMASIAQKEDISAVQKGDSEKNAENDQGDASQEIAVGDLKLNQALLQAIVDEGHRFGAKTLFVDIPSARDRMHYVSPAARLFGAETIARLPVVRPIDRFNQMKRPDVQLYMERGHGHWTALGNRVAAGMTANYIVTHNILSKQAAASSNQ